MLIFSYSVKVGEIDEADMTLIGNSKFEDYFEFDEDNQRIILQPFYQEWNHNYNCLPGAIQPFLNGDVFNTTKYFNTFIEEVHKAVENKKLDLPKGLNLTTKFTPCKVCRSHEDIIPQDVRCRHEPDCADHRLKIKNKEHVETCECKVYTSPCLTFSKIGIVLHLGKYSLGKVSICFYCLLGIRGNK